MTFGELYSPARERRRRSRNRFGILYLRSVIDSEDLGAKEADDDAVESYNGAPPNLSPPPPAGCNPNLYGVHLSAAAHRFVRSRRVAPGLVPKAWNTYDEWRADGLPDTVPLDEEMVEICLDEFVNSDYGETMFGCHERPASVGITGEIGLLYVEGPCVVLSLEGRFWHRRGTVLGRAATWLNAKMPEINEVRVERMADLEDEEEVTDDLGALIAREDKRAPDFNGDRATMERMGLDPDERALPSWRRGFRAGGGMIIPS